MQKAFLATNGKVLGNNLKNLNTPPQRCPPPIFLICDSKDIIEEYKILLNELKVFNEELLDKKRLLAITKADLMDEELEEEIRKDLNKRLKGKNKIPFIFISAATGKNILQLKDMLWEMLNSY